MNYLKEQYLDVDSKENVELVNVLNDDHILKDNQVERNESCNNGMSKERTMRKVADIPTFLFNHEPLLVEYNKSICEHPEYAKRCLRTWLCLHPEYKSNNGSI